MLADVNMCKYPHIVVKLVGEKYDLIGVVAKVSNEMYHAGAPLYDSATFARRAMNAATYDIVISIAREYVEIC